MKVKVALPIGPCFSLAVFALINSRGPLPTRSVFDLPALPPLPHLLAWLISLSYYTRFVTSLPYPLPLVLPSCQTHLPLISLPYPLAIYLPVLSSTTRCIHPSIHPINRPFLACPWLFILQLGGAILAEGASTAFLTGVLVVSNEASLFGGGLSFNDGSSCLMTDSHVTGNAAGGGGGGGLHFSGATGMLDGVTLTGNSVSAGRCVHVLFLAVLLTRKPNIRYTRRLYLVPSNEVHIRRKETIKLECVYLPCLF